MGPTVGWAVSVGAREGCGLSDGAEDWVGELLGVELGDGLGARLTDGVDEGCAVGLGLGSIVPVGVVEGN